MLIAWGGLVKFRCFVFQTLNHAHKMYLYQRKILVQIYIQTDTTILHKTLTCIIHIGRVICCPKYTELMYHINTNTVKPWFVSIIHSRNICNPKHSYIKVNFKNLWLSCDHVAFGIMYYSYCKTSLVYQGKIDEKCLLILWNTHRTSYSQSKVLLVNGISYV